MEEKGRHMPYFGRMAALILGEIKLNCSGYTAETITTVVHDTGYIHNIHRPIQHALRVHSSKKPAPLAYQ